MPKLTEGFSPIAKPSEETSPVLTNLITPIPIHANNILPPSSDQHGRKDLIIKAIHSVFSSRSNCN